LLAPLLARAGPNFIQRTLRSNASAPPAWLATRKVEGTIAIQSATATDASGEWKAHDITAQVEWDGPLIHVTGVTAKIDTASFGGLVDINLTAPIARYHLEGTLNEAAYRGGTLDLMGVVDAEGSGTQFLDSAHGEGTASGRAIVFAPGVVFRTLRTAFHLQPMGQAPRWRFTAIDITQPVGALQGAGASQEDGRVLLDLTQGERPVRYTGTLFSAPPPGK
jgi:hypothetical protein